MSQVFYKFGPFELDASRRLLRRDGEPVALTPKAFDILLALVESAGAVVGKDELIERVWPDSFIEDGNLTYNISVLRKALGERAGEHHYIATVPGRGYQFVAAVQTSRADVAAETYPQADTSPAVGEPAALENQAPRRWRSPRALAFAAIILILVAALTYVLIARRWSERVNRAPRSIAVLPFKSLGGAAGDEFLGLGLADVLITKLGRLHQVVVRPTSAVRRYGEPNQDPVAAGLEQKVDAVLDGSIQKSGDRLRVTVQLIRVADGTHLWTEQFDEKLADMFTVEDIISERLSSALSLELSGEDRRRFARHFTESNEAYQAYLRGRFFWNQRTLSSVNKSVEWFQQAAEKDPTYPLAYAGLADAYIVLGSVFSAARPKELYPKAREAALRALELDDGIAEAHASLATVKMQFDWDWAEAEREFKRAIDLAPSYATAHHWYAFYLADMRRPEEALREIRQAHDLDPLSLIISTDVATILFLARRYDEALAQCRETLELDANYRQAHIILALVYEAKQMYAEWLAEHQKLLIADGKPEAAARVGQIYAAGGHEGVLRDDASKLAERARTGYVSPRNAALLYARLNEKDLAFVWLEKAFEERDRLMLDLNTLPAFDHLRDDPRFQDLLRRVGFVQ
ncbi:MAG TPA: winged helix-turn-helix domain-containing protein [Blastocatellia bacterium]|nr:winged helix-turn-helix domain-containing protein [Blastocatellia bacterium]